MAYQNIVTPRFYINVMEWLHIIGGLTSDSNLDMIFMNPSNPITPDDYSGSDWSGTNDYPMLPEVITPLRDLIGTKGFVAHLGHNYASCELSVRVDQGEPDYYPVAYTENIVNAEQVGDTGKINPDYDGFSIYLGDYTNQPPQLNPRLLYDYIGDGGTTYNGFDVKVGSVILGSTYTMPYSPDLKLTMTREMDGVKRIRTKGGADLVNYKYIKPAMWGDTAGAWELYTGTPTNQALSRSGRRVWDLSFSYLQDSDVFPDVSSLTNYETISPDGTTWDDSMSVTDNTLLNEDTFYSQVIHKTNGGQLPFIFQPDSSNNNPDGFAICKFDMKEFKFEQVANSVYNVKLKIREVW